MFIKFKNMLERNKIPLQFMSNNNSIDDSGFVTPSVSNNWTDVNEVILPYDQSSMPSASGHSTGTLMTAGGTFETYDYVIYTTNKYAIKDRFKWHDSIFEIISENDYTGYSDVHIYFLKGTSAQYG